ncbi:diacylglycerol kinase family protein [Bacillus massilinigeriensis]|uniref:diacylglycerol kinase family protein n=1 Tax=Bacillus massilionigeriensis TaxID=1805475 RepID=UPI00096AF007|nr:diacylglycerol kinase family protein [Bacillus massilionigeriensis]
MNSDLKDKSYHKRRGILWSFRYALEGIMAAIIRERNMKIHLFMTISVICLGWWTSLTKTEWLFISFAIGGMISLELINTAIERIVDLVTEDYHPLAKEAKDIAAGAVLLYSILSVIVGILIFWPKLL